MTEARRERARRLVYSELDLVPVPEVIPGLGVEKGDECLIQTLELRNEDIVALLKVAYSTGRTRGWIEMKVAPEEKVLSYSPAG